ncbi:MAG: hypothetical protein JXQ87_04055 [Bacteroidia bacterium]
MLTLDQMIKFVKGNLLGIKKQEVEDKINASPLISDAIEGINLVKNPEKLEKTIDEINRQIQLKSGASAVIIEETSASNTNASQKTSFSTYSAAASIVLIIAVSATLYFIFSKRSNSLNEIDSVALIEDTEFINNKHNKSSSEPKNQLDLESDTIINDSIEQTGLIALNKTSGEFKRETDLASNDENVINREIADFSSKTLVNNEYEKVAKSLEEPLVASKTKENSELSNSAIETTENEEEVGFLLDSVKDLEDYSAKDTYSGKSKAYTKSSYSAAVDLLNQNRLDEALDQFETIANDKNSANIDDANWNIAQIHIKQGNNRAAKKALKKLKNSSKYGVKAKVLLDEL